MEHLVVSPKQRVCDLTDNTSFVCFTSTNAEWLFDGGKLPYNTEVEESLNSTKVLIYNVSQYHVGSYICHLQDNRNKRGVGVLKLQGMNLS